MFTDIHLLNVPELDVQHNHSFTFGSYNQQVTYFLDKTVYSIDNANFQRRDNNLRVNYHVEELRFVNYVMINHNPSQQWYFYFVVDRKYINEKCTELILKLDVIQTYLFEYKFYSSLVERQHYNRYTADGTVVNAYFKQPIDYNTGEYIVNYSSTIYDYLNDGCYIITSSEPLGKGANYRYTGSIESGNDNTIGEYPYNSSISETRNNRFSKIWKAVKESQSKGLFPSVTYAQYVMECGWDGSTLSETYNNAFGIKAGSGWTGKTVDLPTQEYINGQWVSTTARWRVYDDINQSVRDRTQFLLENSRYTQGGVFTAKTYKEQCQALQNSGYATDPSYASLLISIIEDNNFTIYDTVSSSGGSSSTDGYSKVVTSARKLLGKPYIYGGNYPPLGSHSGTDCSGLCEWAYQDAGIQTGLPHRWTTYTMYPYTKQISLAEAKPGDVLYSGFSGGQPGHVRIIVNVVGNIVYWIGAENEDIDIIESSSSFSSNFKIGTFRGL